MSTNVPTPSLGIMKKQQGERKFQLSRHAPSEDLAFFIRHYWLVSWDLTGQAPYTQHVIPNPCVNLVVEPGKSAIYGPGREKFGQYLEGKGWVFGVKFKPGGFYPFVKQPVSTVLERPIGIDEVFPFDVRELEREIWAATDTEAQIAIVEQMIREKLPAKDDQVALVNEMVERIGEDHEITKVEMLCERYGIHIRSLQRLFDQYVGVSPKWAIRIARIQHAAETVDLSRAHDWSKLSMDLGYHDQAHFIKDFKSIVGQTPEAYAKKD
ncbi:helix-turn-helix domain-containing protein [Paenibacillus whitsoniae]|uniref:AraC family transcriptional regulator n=1 Tax=Paenibacillus whitsoniae TaxID=2496558 RepID=A0A3S0CUM7_9BACL|nr:helix-turn-helix domain-containing protein [Paenibacillus whitsoniae]RTE09102.1 AraC family transcriptional regulator [Paenibacillus whitsoniae]